MTAELIIAAILVAFVLGTILGEEYGRKLERDNSRTRILRAFRIGGLRDW
jgi:hypothetical protein